MHECGSLPRARQDGLLEERVGEELLLYDRESHTAHCLSSVAASVWQNCDGGHDLIGLAQIVGASKDSVAEALHELREKDLLAAEPELTESAVPGESRREAIGRVARYGAAAVAGSMIVSATAATPAMASSEEFKEGWKCKIEETLLNCCECKNACGHGPGGNEKECEEACKEQGRGGFVKWTKNAECKP